MCVLHIQAHGKFTEVVISQGWSSGKTQQKWMDLGISTTFLLTQEGESLVYSSICIDLRKDIE